MRDLHPSIKENILTENDNNVVNFNEMKKQILASAGGGSDNENWLEAMEVGTAFLSREKGTPVDNPFLNQYEVIYKTPTTTLLYVNLPDGNVMRAHVDNLRFSRRMELLVVLGISKQEQSEQTDGTPRQEETSQADAGVARQSSSPQQEHDRGESPSS